MRSEYYVVRQDRFIQATRDSGYKGTESALSELIDNSIQAGASEVHIKMAAIEEEPNGRGRPKMPRVIEVAIVDNGKGMDAETLRRALRFGDSDRFDDRSGLGRFGMGLPNASVSQCTHVDVYSWRKGQKPLCTYIDVEEIANGQMVEVPEPVESTIPLAYQDIVDPTRGTLVVWRDCDRLDHDGRLDTLDRTLRPGLGRIFRHFLVADFIIRINGMKVGPFDPLYLMPQARLDDDHLATQHGDVVRFDVPIPGRHDQVSTVEVVFSLLPEEWQTKYRLNREERRRRHIDSTEGFSIVRARREIDLIRNPYHAKHWTNAWYRVEIRFDPDLDEVFGVTHTKQHASIKSGSGIYERLRATIVANVSTMKDMIVARGKKAHVKKTRPAEEAAMKVMPRLKPVEELEGKPPSQVASEVREFIHERVAITGPEQARNLEDRLSRYSVLIEYESLPGAPFYRTRVVGRSILILLNIHHRFYERCYRRIELESPQGKTGIDLMLMALARTEALGSEEAREWYDDQRQEWSQHIKVFLDQLEEADQDEFTDLSEDGASAA